MNTPYLYIGETKLLRQVKSDLARHEGFREYAYPDPLSPIGKKYKGLYWPWGYVPARVLLSRIPGARDKDGAPWTYGFGFTSNVTPDSMITRIQAERRLEDLILSMNNLLGEKLPTWYNQASLVTKTVLINMAFNIGIDGLLKFKRTLAYVKAFDFANAAHNMELSLWYKQVGTRAKELVQRMRTQSIEPQYLVEDACE
jgi:lysozyme